MAMLPILLVMMLLSFLLCAVFIAAWATMSRPPHALTWAACFAFGGMQWLINIVNGVAGGLPGAWALATLCALGLIFCALTGYRQRSGLPVRGSILAGAAVAVLAAAAVTRLWWPHDGLYLSLIPATAAVAMPLVVAAIRAVPGRRTSGEKVAIATAALLSLFEIVLWVLALRVGAVRDDAAYQLYFTALTAGLPTLYLAMGISGLFLLMADQTAVLERLAHHDPLTGVLNRRGFCNALEGRLAQAGGGCVVLADIDHFKRVNDMFGHAAGDKALEQVAQALRQGVDRDVIVGRIGGEEFALFVPLFGLGRVETLVERLRAAVANIALDGHPGRGVTMSFGIAACRGADDEIDRLLRRADEALYRAKAGGRDRVVASLSERTQRYGMAELDAERRRLARVAR